MKLCPRSSVGVVIPNKNNVNEYVTLYRKKNPPGLAFIAGHINEGETPEEAIERETLEESGLIIEVKFQPVFHQIVKNHCSRGYTTHDWWVYKITEYFGEPELKEPDKHLFVKFMHIDEIRSYLERKDFDPAWSEFILPQLGLL